ncbi:hypothetical protein CF386_05830 [Paraphotobacterium marinum]|uniref:YcgL domain-containing protein CF386_05830 n=1 Tax=Paraphotobacterium marinum TaxID=1755811 RepID=A0A220VDR3_9GAMM|nr:YcgL domain-containing protein [Paraphotobacterium marinum]ASK78558.1 hypothetical protein CF386_05830 [Paraphotobacterium marinum]
MFCYIYKNPKKDGMYLYIPKKDNFESLPEKLKATFKSINFVMAVNLEKRKSLAQVNLEELKKELAERGFYLQLPKEEMSFIDEYKQYFL